MEGSPLSNPPAERPRVTCNGRVFPSSRYRRVPLDSGPCPVAAMRSAEHRTSSAGRSRRFSRTSLRPSTHAELLCGLNAKTHSIRPCSACSSRVSCLKLRRPAPCWREAKLSRRAQTEGRNIRRFADRAHFLLRPANSFLFGSLARSAESCCICTTLKSSNRLPIRRWGMYNCSELACTSAQATLRTATQQIDVT
jgi:hypothetical protein